MASTAVSTSTANGIAFNTSESHNFTANPVRQINAGGIGQESGSTNTPEAPDELRFLFENKYMPGHPKSLSAIAIRSFLLGLVFSASFISAASILTVTNSPLWRIPFFLATLSVFHFLEFWTTARYNTRAAQVSSFLLSQNGSAYNIAHTAAMIECLLTSFFFPNINLIPSHTQPYSTPSLIFVGVCMIVVGQVVRSGAMIQAGTNFNHVIQHKRENEHQLVTTGLYGYLRHPSYFGFFWWGLGTQVVLGNIVCFFAYLLVLWRFFSRRISGEEELLMLFFGEEYKNYRLKTPVGIPFIK